jgi:hypothetical protein
MTVALEQNVEHVLDAIEATYRQCEGREPRKSEIIAAAGVSAKTYYRIMNDFPEAQRALRIAQGTIRHNDSGPGDADVVDDPIAANPMAAVEELLDTIAELAVIIESQRSQIDQLQERLRLTPSPIRR